MVCPPSPWIMCWKHLIITTKCFNQMLDQLSSPHHRQAEARAAQSLEQKLHWQSVKWSLAPSPSSLAPVTRQLKSGSCKVSQALTASGVQWVSAVLHCIRGATCVPFHLPELMHLMDLRMENGWVSLVGSSAHCAAPPDPAPLLSPPRRTQAGGECGCAELGLVSATINTYTHLTLIWAARCLARCAREAFQNIKYVSLIPCP